MNCVAELMLFNMYDIAERSEPWDKDKLFKSADIREGCLLLEVGL